MQLLALIICAFFLPALCSLQKDEADFAPVSFVDTAESAEDATNNSITLRPLLTNQVGASKLKEQIRLKRKAGKQRNRVKGSAKSSNGGETTEAPKPTDEEDAYHVKYETKFAFQNVDEFGLKVKYNKTEHVFYGDSLAGGNTTQPPLVQQTTMQPPPTLFKQSPNTMHSQIINSPAMSSIRNTNRRPAGPQADYSQNTRPVLNEDSLEMIECRKTHFLDNEYEKAIPGMCIMCHRGLGSYRYVEGCNRVDCDEFTPVDIRRNFPDCCPKCKGMTPANFRNDYGKYMTSGSAPPQTHYLQGRNKKSVNPAYQMAHYRGGPSFRVASFRPSISHLTENKDLRTPMEEVKKND